MNLIELAGLGKQISLHISLYRPEDVVILGALNSVRAGDRGGVLWLKQKIRVVKQQRANQRP
jgi:hypothetical protein